MLIRKKKQNGFTIVELLIVIVVIAILAAITIVAYNGVQARSRDSANIQNVRAILRAMELYRADYGVYPPRTATPSTGWGGCSLGNGYSYSIATDGTWMKELIDKGYLSKVPVHPVNDCTHLYTYIHPSSTSYSCTSLTSGYFVLEVTGTEGTMTPSDSATRKSCPEGTATWPVNSNKWVFSGNDT